MIEHIIGPNIYAHTEYKCIFASIDLLNKIQNIMFETENLCNLFTSPLTILIAIILSTRKAWECHLEKFNYYTHHSSRVDAGSWMYINIS